MQRRALIGVACARAAVVGVGGARACGEEPSEISAGGGAQQIEVRRLERVERPRRAAAVAQRERRHREREQRRWRRRVGAREHGVELDGEQRVVVRVDNVGAGEQPRLDARRRHERAIDHSQSIKHVHAI